MTLCISLASWIIQDGNYRDFACGDEAAFAIEFYAEHGFAEVRSSSDVATSLSGIGDDSYAVTGKVIHVADDWWVLDVGLPIFCEEKPPPVARLGEWLRGELSMGIDPFFYFERLAKTSGAPALIYDWRIEKIEILADSTRHSWRQVDRTNAWEDNGGGSEYLLHCARLDVQPRKRRAR